MNVGDSRKLYIYSISPSDGRRDMVGSAWQDSDGLIKGTGIVSCMLFEPVYQSNYKRISMEIHVSPLVAFWARISRSPFMVAEFAEG